MNQEAAVLLQYGCLNWKTLAVGLEHNLCERRDLIDFAVDELVRGVAYAGYEHSVLAAGEEYLSYEFDTLVVRFFEKNEIGAITEQERQRALTTWWHGYLVVIAARGLSDEAALDAVDALYWDEELFDGFEGFELCRCESYREDWACAAVDDGPCTLRALKEAASALQRLASTDYG